MYFQKVYCLIHYIQFEMDNPKMECKIEMNQNVMYDKHLILTSGADVSPPSPCNIAGSTNLIPRMLILPRTRRF